MTASQSSLIGPIRMRAELQRWPLAAPFRIAGHTFEEVAVLVITLEKDGQQGRGEATGVYYRDDNAASMLRQIERVRTVVERGMTQEGIQTLLPPGGARNALDCALWDLEARVSGIPVWRNAGLNEPRAILTTFTCGADKPDRMAVTARAYKHAQAIKLKLVGDTEDAGRVRAVREARTDVWLGVDANQAFTPAFFEQLMPVLQEMKVDLIEQPFPVGQDSLLDVLRSPIPIAADESVQTVADIPSLVGRFNVINIKLDKCGGFTEALRMVQTSLEFGLDAMVGNMIGTSLAMAPAFLVGQRCKIVDLDGPIFLKGDREIAVQYSNGLIECPAGLWGH